MASVPGTLDSLGTLASPRRQAKPSQPVTRFRLDPLTPPPCPGIPSGFPDQRGKLDRSRHVLRGHFMRGRQFTPVGSAHPRHVLYNCIC